MYSKFSKLILHIVCFLLLASTCWADSYEITETYTVSEGSNTMHIPKDLISPEGYSVSKNHPISIKFTEGSFGFMARSPKYNPLGTSPEVWTFVYKLYELSPSTTSFESLPLMTACTEVMCHQPYKVITTEDYGVTFTITYTVHIVEQPVDKPVSMPPIYKALGLL